MRNNKNIIYRRVSLTDLREADIAVVIVKTDTGLKIDLQCSDSELYNYLRMLGVKINHHLEVMPKCEHVRFNGKRTVDYSIVGEERNDKAWLASGYASEEVKISSSKMRDMLSVVNRLSRGGDR